MQVCVSKICEKLTSESQNYNFDFNFTNVTLRFLADIGSRKAAISKIIVNLSLATATELIVKSKITLSFVMVKL